MSLNSLAESNLPASAVEAGGAPLGERYLNCHLVPNMTVLLPVSHLTEVLTIPIQQVTPIPVMNPWVMGVHNWRGEVLWMVDLGHLLGLTPWYQQSNNISNHNALVIRNHDGSGHEGELKIGLVVSQVQDIEVIPTETMRASIPSGSLASPELAPYFKGSIITGQGHLQGCLDPEAVFSMIAK